MAAESTWEQGARSLQQPLCTPMCLPPLLAVQVFGYLLRTVPHHGIAAAMRSVLAEGTAVASQARVHGCGALLAESVKGPKHALHSRAPALLQALLDQGLCRSAQVAAGGGGGQPGGSEAAAEPQEGGEGSACASGAMCTVQVLASRAVITHGVVTAFVSWRCQSIASQATKPRRSSMRKVHM